MTPLSPHIVRRFDADLLRVTAGAAALGGRAEALLSSALDAIARGDETAQPALEAEAARIDAAGLEIERAATEVLALRQPMAADLATVLCAMKVATALRRAGRMARGLRPPAAPGRAQGPAPIQARDAMRGAVLRLGFEAQRQLGDALSAWQDQDVPAAQAIARRDARLDDLCAAILTGAGRQMSSAPEAIGPCARWVMVARNLERIGDQAAEIAAATCRRASAPRVQSGPAPQERDAGAERAGAEFAKAERAPAAR
jgi:phosphate transport system protein